MSLQPLSLEPAELGESPFWHPTEQRLYWCDITGCSVHAWSPKTGQTWRWNMPSEPGCCAPAAPGQLVIGLRDGFYVLHTMTGQLRCLAKLPQPQHDPARLRLNDGRCDAAGRFWAGSVVQPRIAPDAALWCLQASAKGYRVECMAGDNFTANGLAFSPDNSVMYWSNTPAHRIDRFAFDLATGAVHSRTPWKSFALPQDASPYAGRPDGAAVDVQGNYWVAMYEGACVLQLSPLGEVLQRIPTPVQCPTMVCFGGPELRTLYITSAAAGRTPQERNAAIPAGSLMQLPVNIPGLPVNFFKLAASDVTP